MSDLRCLYCAEMVTPSHHGPVGSHQETTCQVAPRQGQYAGAHAVPDDVCGFDTDGDGNCAMRNCPACSGRNTAKVLAEGLCGYRAVVVVKGQDRTGTCTLLPGHESHMPGYAEHALWVNSVSPEPPPLVHHMHGRSIQDEMESW